MPETRRSPMTAAAWSFLLPGAGQLYNGERAKGLGILCVDAGVLVGMLLAIAGPAALRSWLTVIALGVAYVGIWIPAVVDAYQYAAGAARPMLSGRQAWYVLFMLAMVGPGAIPLLWQSPAFSKGAKIALTAFVLLAALLMILFIVWAGPKLEQLLRDLGVEQSSLLELYKDIQRTPQ